MSQNLDALTKHLSSPPPTLSFKLPMRHGSRGNSCYNFPAMISPTKRLSRGVLLGSLQLAGLGLLLDVLLAQGLGLSGVDGLHEHTLVLVLVTLGVGIQLSVQVLIDLLLLSVLAQQTTKDSLASHPDDLQGHTGVGRTLSLTIAGVSSLSLGSHDSLVASLGVDSLGLLVDDTILDQLANTGSAVGSGDSGGLRGIKPDLPLAALEQGGSQSLL